MDTNQVRCLFDTLLRLGCPWAAVLMLVQIFMGERADCARQCRWSWLRGMAPGSLKPPSVEIPDEINGKTVAREIPLHEPFARLLLGWVEGRPSGLKR